MTKMIPVLLTVLLSAAIGRAEDLGNLSASPYNFDSSSNPFGKGSPFAPNGINNPFSPYGSPFSNQSATNPFATDAPRLYDQQGNYRGKLSANPYDPDSTSNPFCRYGSPFSYESMNNQYGAGSPYCVMPNHWHLVVWPRGDGDLSRFMNWLTLTHTQRWHRHRNSVGNGHVYRRTIQIVSN